MPWLIGQAFVQIGATAMIVLILIAVVLNLLMLLLFARISDRPRLISEDAAIAD